MIINVSNTSFLTHKLPTKLKSVTQIPFRYTSSSVQEYVLVEERMNVALTGSNNNSQVFMNPLYCLGIISSNRMQLICTAVWLTTDAGICAPGGENERCFDRQ